MARLTFNHDWAYRLPQGPFAAVQGGDQTLVPVTLPHDALRDTPRTPDAPGRGATAYYPQGAFTYLKSLHVPGEWSERLVSLEIQGAYRHAMVFVNDEFAGNRADGYARFPHEPGHAAVLRHDRPRNASDPGSSDRCLSM